ncbi:hypothetical protein ACHAXH_009493 [Discostella pseudostelligera]
MSLESTPSEAFLNDASEDDFANLDSMGFTTGSSAHSQQYGMNTVLMPPSTSGGGGSSGGDYVMSSSSHRVGGGGDGGERDGGSLFDRIQARGEDYSQPNNSTHNNNMPRIPVYGASRDDPYYIAANNANHHYPTNFQDKATMALQQTGETMKSLWHVGVSGAQTIGTMAKDRMMGSGNNGERTYNNNFLLREEDTLEQGGIGGGGGSATMMSSQPPPPQLHTGITTTTGGSSSTDQAYSMLQYGKTFCEDVIGFVGQLPPWGKAIVGVIFLWILYVVFG